MDEANGSTQAIITFFEDNQSLQIDLGNVNLTLEGIVPTFITEGREGIRHYVPLSDEEMALLRRTAEYMIPRAKDPENRDRFEALRNRLSDLGER